MTSIHRHGTTARWSDAVVHAGVIYFVEVADDPTQNTRGQIAQVFQQVADRLQLLNSDHSRLLQVTIILPYPEDLTLFNDLWEAWLPKGSAPSRACLHTPLVKPEYRIEIIAMAAEK